MPKLSEREATRPIKLLLIGDSGAGKTGSLWSLAKAGYNIRLYEFDPGGMDVLLDIGKADGDTEALDRISYQQFTNQYKSVGTGQMLKIIPAGLPKAFGKALGQMTTWNADGEDLGDMDQWGPDTVVVVDSLDFAGKAALEHALSAAGRSGQQAQIQDWGNAMRMLEQMVAILTSDAIKCNVIVISHITFIGDEDTSTPTRGYPAALGAKLPPAIGAYFNHTLIAKAVGSGASTKRKIRTVPDGNIEAKSPLGLASDLPLETGLADYFAAHFKTKK